jgi:hypothetical protein
MVWRTPGIMVTIHRQGRSRQEPAGGQGLPWHVACIPCSRSAEQDKDDEEEAGAMDTRNNRTTLGSGQNQAKILRFPTLRILELMRTRVQSVRVDLVGPQSRLLVRLGTWLIFLPLVALGYLLVLAALMRMVAVSIGWGVTLLVFGAAHLVIGALGILFGRDVGQARSQPVLEPELDSTRPVPRNAATVPPSPTV